MEFLDEGGKTPYEVLGLEKGSESTADEIKKVGCFYRRMRVPRSRLQIACRCARCCDLLHCCNGALCMHACMHASTLVAVQDCML